MGTINLKPGVLRLFEWKKDFNMHKQRNTHAQVWIRLLELPREYWMDRILCEISCAVGTTLIIDNATTKRLYGHYARILIDMDFSRKLFHEITVEREGYAFNVEVAYEWLPDFCTHCQNIGHDVSACRWLYPRKESKANKETIAQGKKPVPTNKHIWVPTRENPAGIGSSLAFAQPHQESASTPSTGQQHQTSQQEPTTAPILQETLSLVVTEEQHALDNTAILVVDITNDHYYIDDTIPLEADTDQQDEVSHKSPSPDVTVNHDIS